MSNFEFDANTFPNYLTDKRMSPNGRKQAPKNLRSLNHEILRLTLLGWKGTDIAKHLGITPITVSNTLNSVKGRAVLMMMQQARSERTVDIAEDMRAFAPVALRVAQEITTDVAVPPAIRLRGAELNLGLAGFVKPQRIQSQTVHTHLTMEDVEDLKKRARERAAASGALDYAQLPSETGIVIDLESIEDESHSMVPVGEPTQVGCEKSGINKVAGGHDDCVRDPGYGCTD